MAREVISRAENEGEVAVSEISFWEATATGLKPKP